MCFLLSIICEKPIMREQSDWLAQKDVSHLIGRICQQIEKDVMEKQ